MTQPNLPDRFRNHILRALPADELAVLQPDLHHVSVPSRQVVQPAGELIEAAYFVEGGMVSLVAQLEEGNVVEVAAIGRSGLVGAELVYGTQISFVQGIGQVDGEAWRIVRPRFLDALEICPTLQERARNYRELLYVVAAQTAACGQSHDINRRLARWLLTVADEVGAPTFRLTQEFMSEMLAVQRPTVTIAARTLQGAGVIGYRRGRIEILDREALEEISCACYHALRRQYERLAG